MKIPFEVYNDNNVKTYKKQPLNPKSPYDFVCVYERKHTDSDKEQVKDSVGNILKRGEYYGEWIDKTEQYKLMNEKYIAEKELNSLDSKDDFLDSNDVEVRAKRGILDGYIRKRTL